MVDLPDKKVKKRKATEPAAAMMNAERKAKIESSKSSRSVAVEAKLDAVAQEEQPEEEEVEVLSHAEQRKRRKLEKAKALAKGVDGAEGSGSAEDVNGGTATSSKIAGAPEQSKQSKSTYGIWVGNLAFKTDADKLRSFFSECGNITRVNLPKGTKFQPNKGFAYIDFDTREAVEQAIGLSESGLDGRRLLIKDSSDYKGRPKNENVDAAAKALLGDNGKSATSSDGANTAEKSLSKSARKILERQKNPPAPTLFVGNLAYDATIDSIREAFEARAVARQRWESKKGSKKSERKGKGRASTDDDDSDAESDAESEADASIDVEQEAAKPRKTPSRVEPASQGGAAGIRQVRIGTFEDSGKCKGWAFVDFYTAAQATQSLIDGRNHYMNGRTLTVEFASADAVRRGGGKMEGVDTSSGQKKGRSGQEGRAPSGKRKREERDDDENDRHNPTEEPEPPKQAFYRPPLALEPWKEAAKVHKPNKEERQALREERKSKGKRQKPGAALATAQREKIAIQPAAGKKITFD